MLKQTTLKNKISILPFSAALMIVIIVVVTLFSASANRTILQKTANHSMAVADFNMNLLGSLNSIENQWKMMLILKNKSQLSALEASRDQFTQYLREGRNGQLISVQNADSISVLFQSYFLKVRNIHMIISENMTDNRLSAEIEKLQSDYFRIVNHIKKSYSEAEYNTRIAFITANRNSMKVFGGIIMLSFLFLSAFSIISFKIVNSVSNPLKHLVKLAESLAMGDLTVEVTETDSSDETGLLLKTFKKMVDNLRSLTHQIKESGNALATASNQISASVTQITSAATETAAAASETSTTVEEVRQTALDSNRKAKTVSGNSQKAVEISLAGQKTVEETIEGMHRIEQQMESIAESIMKLSEHGQAIGDIIATVEDVAEQSRLLAVNASIEAVKAGEHGKGFAVVAQEVRSLAEQSKAATNRVRNILDDIQKATSEAVMKTEQGSKAVDAGVAQSSESGEAITQLAESVEAAAQATTQIAVSSQEQLVGMDQVVSAMDSIKQASSQNVSATKQVETAAKDLQALGLTLTKILDQYQL